MSFLGDEAVLNLDWVIALPPSLGFTAFSGRPAHHHQGYAAPLFGRAAEQDDSPHQELR